MSLPFHTPVVRILSTQGTKPNCGLRKCLGLSEIRCLANGTQVETRQSPLPLPWSLAFSDETAQLGRDGRQGPIPFKGMGLCEQALLD